MSAEDPNVTAHRILAKLAEDVQAISAEFAAARDAYADRIQNCDERTRNLIRAAFEAGSAWAGD